MSDRPKPRLDEDHGTHIHYDFEIGCKIDGCDGDAEVLVGGYIHFTMDGEQYSRDEMRLCQAHHQKVQRLIDR